MPIWTILLLAGCMRQEVALVTSEVPELLRIADAQWARRGEVGFDAVEETLNEAWQAEPDHPEVLWRLVRLRVARGLVETDPRAAQFAFAEARAIGVTCLELEPAFAQYRAEIGWSGAIALLTEQDAPCGAWTALAWARWIDAHGPVAAALDFAPLTALIVRTSAMAAGEPLDVARYAEGLVTALRPSWEGGDPERAAALLADAARRRPDELYRRADLIRLVAIPAGDEALAREVATAILSAPAETPEDEVAHAVAAAALRSTGPAAAP